MLDKMNRLFSGTNRNFAAQVIISILGLLAAWGVEFQTPPEVLGDQIYGTISNGSYYALVAMFATSLAMPIYNFIRDRDREPFSVFIMKANTWVYLVALFLSALTLFGIQIEQGVAGTIVNAFSQKDWTQLISIIFTSIISPVLRYLLDRSRTVAVR